MNTTQQKTHKHSLNWAYTIPSCQEDGNPRYCKGPLKCTDFEYLLKQEPHFDKTELHSFRLKDARKWAQRTVAVARAPLFILSWVHAFIGAAHHPSLSCIPLELVSMVCEYLEHITLWCKLTDHCRLLNGNDTLHICIRRMMRNVSNLYAHTEAHFTYQPPIHRPFCFPNGGSGSEPCISVGYSTTVHITVHNMIQEHCDLKLGLTFNAGSYIQSDFRDKDYYYVLRDVLDRVLKMAGLSEKLDHKRTRRFLHLLSMAMFDSETEPYVRVKVRDTRPMHVDGVYTMPLAGADSSVHTSSDVCFKYRDTGERFRLCTMERTDQHPDRALCAMDITVDKFISFLRIVYHRYERATSGHPWELKYPAAYKHRCKILKELPAFVDFLQNRGMLAKLRSFCSSFVQIWK